MSAGGGPTPEHTTPRRPSRAAIGRRLRRAAPDAADETAGPAERPSPARARPQTAPAATPAAVPEAIAVRRRMRGGVVEAEGRLRRASASSQLLQLAVNLRRRAASERSGSGGSAVPRFVDDASGR